MVYPSGIGQ